MQEIDSSLVLGKPLDSEDNIIDAARMSRMLVHLGLATDVKEARERIVAEAREYYIPGDDTRDYAATMAIILQAILPDAKSTQARETKRRFQEWYGEKLNVDTFSNALGGEVLDKEHSLVFRTEEEKALDEMAGKRFSKQRRRY